MITAPSVEALQDSNLPVGAVAWVNGVPHHRRAITGLWEAYPPEADIYQHQPVEKPKRKVKRRKRNA